MYPVRTTTRATQQSLVPTTSTTVGIGNQPVLVLVTAGTCGHCTTFKNQVWNQLKNKLQTDGKVKVVEINVPTTGDRIPAQYPTGLQQYIGWFPTLALFTANSWNAGGSLAGSVLNGRLVNNRMTQPPREEFIPMTADSIYNWINREVSGPLFTQGPSVNLGWNQNAARSESLSESSRGSESTGPRMVLGQRPTRSGIRFNNNSGFRGVVYKN